MCWPWGVSHLFRFSAPAGHETSRYGWAGQTCTMSGSRSCTRRGWGCECRVDASQWSCGSSGGPIVGRSWRVSHRPAPGCNAEGEEMWRWTGATGRPRWSNAERLQCDLERAHGDGSGSTCLRGPRGAAGRWGSNAANAGAGAPSEPVGAYAAHSGKVAMTVMAARRPVQAWRVVAAVAAVKREESNGVSSA